MTQERVSYDEIRELIFSGYYSYCRQKISSRKKWQSPDREHEVGFAYEQLTNAFETPIEYLMLEVLTMILDAGRGDTAFVSFHRDRITSIVRSIDVDAVLSQLPEEERNMFVDDLILLGISLE